MDSSVEDTLIMLAILNNHKKKRKKRIMWCREHFLLRSSRGEFHQTFSSLIRRRDETLFFNYLRMSYRTYDELKNLVLPRLQPIGCNYREPISAEEKLFLALRWVLFIYMPIYIFYNLSQFVTDINRMYLIKGPKLIIFEYHPGPLHLPHPSPNVLTTKT